MKITLHTKKLKFILLLVTVLVGQMALAFDIVSYALTSNLTSTSVDIPANAGKAFSTTSSGTISYGGSILQNSGWNGSGKYWQTAAFSTFGYHTIGVSAVMKSDNNTGPKDFRLNYSIDNGANWSSTAIATYSITGVAGIVYTGALPQACQNQNSVMLRWTNYTTIAVNKTTAGTVTSLGKSYISTVSITGYQPIVPSSQANNITIVSRTPTTITVGWTKGINGDSVVVMMNTTNDFTPVPINDQSFTAMTGTYTSGRQVIYVGTKSIFTVNVTSATDQYYFRVFDYIPNNGMYRYITTSSDPGNGGVVKNPILCALENIHINPAIDIRLNRATLGATITATKKSAISERAIYWDINPGVSELTGNKISDFINEDGSYSFPVGEITRGSTIYFVASVKNESGTIWSSEESFINTPIFTGTGNWETAARWNVQEVPGSNGDATYGSVDDSPFIEGDCTLNDTTRCNILTITAGNRLTIQPSKSLEVIGDLINDAGTSGLVIKADSTDANGSLIFPQGLTTVPATVEMYSKASWNGSLSNLDNNKYKWQYFGIPVDTLPANPTFYGGYVRYWEETGDNITNHWLPMTTTSKLSPFVGYEICQIRPKIYTFNGNLVNRDFSQTDLAYTTSALYPGQHIFANPYTAAINISALAGAFGKNMEEAVYLYNAGTYSQWEASNGAGKNDSTTTNPGQYTVSTPLSAGRANIGVPTQIPSMQAFLVKAKSNIPLNDSLAFSYANVVGINTEKQRARSTQTTIATRIDIRSTHFADRMWIFTDSTCTNKYDRGWDGSKLMGSPRAPQLFAMETDGNYQINAVADMNNTDLGFITGEEKEFTIKFTHENADKQYSSIYLYDLVAKTSTDITLSGSEYKFTAEPNNKIVKRFKIITSNLKDTTNEASQMKIFSADGMIMIQNNSDESGELKIYDTTGRFVQQASFGANNSTAVFKNLSPGVYLAKTISNGKELTQTFLVR